MTTTLHIGDEEKHEKQSDEELGSSHVLNLKDPKPKKADINLRAEIKGQHKKAGRICIVGELSRSRQGLSRVPMILAALFTIVLLNFGQLFFLGQKKGNESLALASEAFTSLSDASHAIVSGDSGADAVLFEHAAELFEEAKEKGDFLLGQNTEWITPPQEVRSFRNLIEAGELMAQVGEHIAALRYQLNDIPEEGSLTDYIRELSENHIEPAATLLTDIDTLLDDVDLTGTPYQDKFYDYRQKLSALSGVFEVWLEIKEPLLYALGDRYVQHYAIVFMNDNEMRPGGGFMGSMAIVEINDGRLTDFQFHDIFDFSQQLHDDIPLPIHELEEVITTWRLHDANTSAHFPSSAQNIKTMLEKSGGQGVDGVIAVNLGAASELIKLMPQPIQLPSLEQPLNPDTFAFVLSTLVEGKALDTAQPKVILEELIQTFLGSLKDPVQQLTTGLEILEQSRNKNINFYHDHPQVQSLVEDLGMAGALPDLNTLEGDFVLPVFTNLGGNKADAYVNTAFLHHTELSEAQTLSTFTVRRAHMFLPDTMTWLKDLVAQYGFTDWDEELERIMGNDVALSGIRIYLPEGAQITSTTGVHRDDLQFYYDPELNHSYYYYRQSLYPGEIQEFSVSYSLPASMEDIPEYNFQLLKQPGFKLARYEKTVNATSILTAEPLATEKTDSYYSLSDSFHRDLSVKLLYR